MSLSNT